VVVAVFLLLLLALYIYLIKKVLEYGEKKWLIAIFIAIAVKIGAIVYMVVNAPPIN
jgi:hypothetical protein